MLKDDLLPEVIGETEVDGKLHWMFSDGQTRPVVRGGATDDDEGDDDEDTDDEDDLEDEDDDDGGDEGADGDEDEGDLEGFLEEFADGIVERVESLIDSRINKLTRSLDRKYGNNSDRGSSKRGRGGRDENDDRDRFSAREARSVGQEFVRESLGRMTTAERETARALLIAEVASQHSSGEDDEELAGEAAARAVVKHIKALRKDSTRSTRRTSKRSGDTATQRRPGNPATSRKSSKQMSAGAKRAAEMFGTQSK